VIQVLILVPVLGFTYNLKRGTSEEVYGQAVVTGGGKTANLGDGDRVMVLVLGLGRIRTRGEWKTKSPVV